MVFLSVRTYLDPLLVVAHHLHELSNELFTYLCGTVYFFVKEQSVVFHHLLYD